MDNKACVRKFSQKFAEIYRIRLVLSMTLGRILLLRKVLLLILAFLKY